MNYDVTTMQQYMDEAVRAVNFLLTHANRVLERESPMLRDLIEVDYALNINRDAFMDEPFSQHVRPNIPTVRCVDCDSNGIIREATMLAPSVVTCPSPTNPTARWTFTYSPICYACAEDWWGYEDCDRPDEAPPMVSIPDAESKVSRVVSSRGYVVSGDDGEASGPE